MMNYNTVFVGMDVHKESFSLCCYDIESDSVSYQQKTVADYRQILAYLASVRRVLGENTNFVCGYEAGCLGFTLYHQLIEHNVKCIILAPTTMPVIKGKKKLKTDKRDAENIARCLAYHTYKPVYIPTEQDEQVKEYIRMRDDHKLALKKVKQQILSFCMRHGFHYESGRSHWTESHMRWLKSLKADGLYEEILIEYLLTYENLMNKIKRLDVRIEELALKDEYHDKVKKLSCFIGIQTHTALSVIVEIGDFNRFATADKFASYLGLVPGEDSSGDTQTRLGITKAGNTHVRRLLVEAAQSYSRGCVGFKSEKLRKRQLGNSPAVIAYADRGNERLRRRYYKMVLTNGKRANVAKAAVARELACFIWGMMTENIA